MSDDEEANQQADAYERLVSLRLRADEFAAMRQGKGLVDRELTEAAYRAAFHAYVDKYINKRS